MANHLPMKFFADWTGERCPSNCTPRICTLRLTRLVILESLSSETKSVFIAIKMQKDRVPNVERNVTDRLQHRVNKIMSPKGSKRTLRSNPIELWPNGQLDTRLELTFNMLYSHMLKGKGSRLQITIQKRKRYKKRKVMGYKTLAVGVVSMAQALQMKGSDFVLDLLVVGKDRNVTERPGARVYVCDMGVQPAGEGGPALCRSPPLEVADCVGLDEASWGEDSPPYARAPLKRSRNILLQRNLKQRVVSLLKRFRTAERREALRKRLSKARMGPAEEFLFDLDDWSDSDEEDETDTLSVHSAPRPRLRPFFADPTSPRQPPSAPTSARHDPRPRDSRSRFRSLSPVMA